MPQFTMRIFKFILAAIAVFILAISIHFRYAITLNYHDFWIVNRKTYDYCGAYWCYTEGYPTNVTYTFAHKFFIVDHRGATHIWP
jgi:hypothetical protein